MKKLLTILLTVLSCAAIGQVKPVQGIGVKGNIVKALGQLATDSALLFPKDTIRLTSGDRAIAIKGNTPYIWLGSKWELIISGEDTLYVDFPLRVRVDTNFSPTHRILFILHANGLVNGGIVTKGGCLTVDVTPATYVLGFFQYTTAGITLTVPPADNTFPTAYEVVVDTFGIVSILRGTPSATPLPVSTNPSSQIVLSTFTVPAAASCLGIIQKVIYDQDSTGEFTHTQTGTQTTSFVNTDNPYHLSKAIFMVSHASGATITFTDSGLDTVQLGEIIKFWIYLNGAFTGQQIQVQYFLNGVAVSNAIVINSYFNTSDSNAYQNLSVPLSAWSFTTRNAVFNKVVITFAGDDLSGAKGFYLDYIQLQTGGNNVTITPADVYDFAKNTTRDSIILTMTDGRRIAVKDSIGSGAAQNTVTEQKIYNHGEFLWNTGLNTSTGAFTSDKTKDISDYLPIEGSTSITISTVDSSDITIFGATYDTAFTYISNIRSSGLIGTLLKTYTFTTPSNARYIVLYTKAAGDSFYLRLRVNSTNTITYNIPITPEQFTGTSATAKIQAAVNFARWTNSGVELKGEYDLDSAIILSSGSTIILRDAKLLNKYGMKDNTFRNEAVAHPLNHIFARGNRNIKIIGIGNAILQGSTNAYPFSDVTTELFKIQLLHFANVEQFQISGVTIKAPRTWATCFEQCRTGILKDIVFECETNNQNQDGAHFEKGCHGITVENISGNTADDMLALNNLKINNNQLILGQTIYEPYAKNLDIYDFSISNIQRSKDQVPFGGAQQLWSSIRLITGDTGRIHDIFIRGVHGIPEIQIQSASAYYLTTAPTVNDVYNIHILDAFCPIYIYRAIKNSTFVNVPPFDSTGVYATVKPPTGSLNIFRKYQNDQAENIDSVVASVESISLKTPVLTGSPTTGNLILKSNSNLNLIKGKILFGTSAYDENVNSLGLGKNNPTDILEVLTPNANSGVRIRSESGVGNPAVNLVLDGVINGYFATLRTANQLAPGTSANDIVIRADVGNIDFIKAGGSFPLLWQITTAGHFISPTDNANDIGASGATRPRNIFIGTNGIFGGKIFAGGTTTPTALVHLAAGTATANTAPLKFTSGTNLSTTEAGAIEFNGTHLYFTATNAGTRYQLDQQVGATAAPQTLTDGATITWDVSLGYNATVTIAATGRTLTITNAVSGTYYTLRVKQDGTGSRTITTWPTNTKWPGGTAPTLTTTANAEDILVFYYNGTNYYTNYNYDFK